VARTPLRALGLPVLGLAVTGGLVGSAEAWGLAALAALLQAALAAPATVPALAGVAAGWFGLRLAAELVEVALSSWWFSVSERNARRHLVRAALAASWPAVRDLSAGALAVALGEGVLHRQQFVRAATNLAATGATSGALLVAAIRLDVVWALATLALAAGVVALLRPFARRSARAAERFRAGLEAFSGRLAVALSIPLEVRSFGVVDALAAPMRDAIASLRRHRAVMGGSVASSAAWSVFLGQAGVLLGVALLGGGQGASDAPVAVLVALQCLRFTGKLQTQLQRARDAAPFVDGVDGLAERLEASAVPAASGGEWREGSALSLRGVGVRHGERVVLEGVDLDVGPAERVALVGASGSGKSTLLDIALRLVPPQAGTIEPSGVSEAAWRAAVAWVPQEPTLSSGSVADAIRFHRRLEDGAVEDAAAEAGLGEALARWSEGLRRHVGPGGSALSGGERQRVALARALAGRPAVLLMDEPTSALDTEAEAVVLDWLSRAGRQRSVVVVSHREATVAFADRVLTLEEGTLRPSQ
jgi:ABC-type multidrug transport system fused ATPase/permease subunit